MSIAYRIHKRPFNPNNPEAKNIRVLVASFTKAGNAEANLLYDLLQQDSTSFNPEHPEFASWRYTLTAEPEPVRSQFADLQIDTSTATPTARPITFSLSWDIKHDRCLMLASTAKHGTIRADITNEPAARRQFVRNIKQVWPNADLATK